MRLSLEIAPFLELENSHVRYVCSLVDVEASEEKSVN